MNEQYFSENPSAVSEPKDFELCYRGKSLIFTSDNGVFSKGELDKGTKTLLDGLIKLDISSENGNLKLLDLGCGWGAVSVILGLFYKHFSLFASDVNERAISLLELNARRHGVPIKAIKSDGFDEIDEKFDIIVTNPPIRTGKSKVLSLLSGAREHLKPEGRLVAVFGKKQGAESYQKKLAEMFGNCSIIERNGDFRVLLCRLEE